MLLIPSLLALMAAVHRHYQRVGAEIACAEPLDLTSFHPPTVVVPIDRWTQLSRYAVRFALSISPHVIGLHINCGEQTEKLHTEWEKLVEYPVRELGLPQPKFVVVDSPYRFVVRPIVDYVLDLARTDGTRQIAVLIPEMVERRWYAHFLHNQRAAVLKALLYVEGSQRIVVMNLPWYLKS